MTPTPLRFTLIVAVTPSLGIGKNGTLPWPRIKSEMAYFARVTKRSPAQTQNAVIMGRKTWESIPAKFRPLPNRLNVVVTTNPSSLELTESSGAIAVSSLTEALGMLRGPEDTTKVDRIFVIGGGQIYAEAARTREAERILLTRIQQDYDCDTLFPLKLGSKEGDAANWSLRTDAERDEWLGEQSPGGEEWTVEMWEKTDKAK